MLLLWPPLVAMDLANEESVLFEFDDPEFNSDENNIFFMCEDTSMEIYGIETVCPLVRFNPLGILFIGKWHYSGTGNDLLMKVTSKDAPASLCGIASRKLVLKQVKEQTATTTNTISTSENNSAAVSVM